LQPSTLRDLLQKESPTVGSIYIEIGQIYADLYQNQKAFTSFQKAFQIMQNAYKKPSHQNDVVASDWPAYGHLLEKYDPAKAQEWYQKAANQGDRVAAYLLKELTEKREAQGPTLSSIPSPPYRMNPNGKEIIVSVGVKEVQFSDGKKQIVTKVK
jgi:TPR repeat protein